MSRITVVHLANARNIHLRLHEIVVDVRITFNSALECCHLVIRRWSVFLCLNRLCLPGHEAVESTGAIGGFLVFILLSERVCYTPLPWNNANRHQLQKSLQIGTMHMENIGEAR